MVRQSGNAQSQQLVQSAAKLSNMVKFNSMTKFGGGRSHTHLSATLTEDVAVEIDSLSGPMLSAKKRGVVDQFVAKMGGKRTIQRILIGECGTFSHLFFLQCCTFM
jgi:hypothetical protein